MKLLKERDRAKDRRGNELPTHFLLELQSGTSLEATTVKRYVTQLWERNEMPAFPRWWGRSGECRWHLLPGRVLQMHFKGYFINLANYGTRT